MIQYALKCPDGHQFDSWFQNAAAFDKLRQAGMVTCAVCGSVDIEKAIMAPRVHPARSAASPAQEPEPVAAPKERPLSAPASAAEQALAEIKKHIEANSDYVGKNFAKEARAIHTGDAPERAIYGEANADEAKSLIEDGVPVAPLPFRPGRKSN
ncbi:DUF1178 family protein [Cognatishimia maritima]|uniref:DUF1178 family protein n=1 Tax=Cognatishimia maritima TaxID=870908 RepID=A0A1M5VEL4_9RHOB|nr:DUF1178 family protein [Cognatishimia maritima]SHH73680.1 hypothetical protein SAMN04488044_3140 [Cognatishimia maritima]